VVIGYAYQRLIPKDSGVENIVLEAASYDELCFLYVGFEALNVAPIPQVVPQGETSLTCVITRFMFYVIFVGWQRKTTMMVVTKSTRTCYHRPRSPYEYTFGM
jgi:hypothetical protein